MSLILSLQGCMAVGKTTALQYLHEHAPYIHISYEENADIVEEIKQRKWNKNVYEDFTNSEIVAEKRGAAVGTSTKISLYGYGFWSRRN